MDIICVWKTFALFIVNTVLKIIIDLAEIIHD